jgi:hypothetical protein
LLPAARAAADDSVELSAHHQVAETQRPGGVDAGPPEYLRDFRAREPLAALQRPGEHGVAPPEARGVQLELTKGVGTDGEHARGGKREHPADVVAGHEVPRRTQEVGAHDRPVGERALHHLVRGGGHPLRDRPLGGAVVLRLDRSQPAHHAFRFFLCRTYETLVGEPLPGDLRR